MTFWHFVYDPPRKLFSQHDIFKYSVLAKMVVVQTSCRNMMKNPEIFLDWLHTLRVFEYFNNAPCERALSRMWERKGTSTNMEPNTDLLLERTDPIQTEKSRSLRSTWHCIQMVHWYHNTCKKVIQKFTKQKRGNVMWSLCNFSFFTQKLCRFTFLFLHFLQKHPSNRMSTHCYHPRLQE